MVLQALREAQAVVSARASDREASRRQASRRQASLPRWATRVLVVLVGAQVGAVVVLGATTILRYPLWSPVDEMAHFENIAWIADHGGYLVLGKAPASEQALAIFQGVYPRHTDWSPLL